MNAECDDETTAFTTDGGYVSLTNFNYTCDVSGDGIQADTVVYINGGNYDIRRGARALRSAKSNIPTPIIMTMK